MMLRHAASTSGSSPLTRGKRDAALGEAHGPGLIPAHAGKTPSTQLRAHSHPAHPRSRGENSGPRHLGACTGGSSPLTGGKTPRRQWTAFRPSAHPRSRGENWPTMFTYQVCPGSSPLTRGKHLDRRATVQADGLIPAHAGKTCSCRWSDPRRAAHPRSRGENASRDWPLIVALGSSPLTRGKRRGGACRTVLCGLIPAHAGKTAVGAGCASAFGAHPRSRGENGLALGFGVGVWGSSPLTRGKLEGVISLDVLQGLIPAHAGKTTVALPGARASRAHPRSRGENR